MSAASTNFNASASHISMAYRPYGPRMHLDENAIGAGPDVVIAAPEGTGDDLSPSEAAAAYLAATAPKAKKPIAAVSADPATAEDELSPEDDADPEEIPPIGEDEEADPEAEKLPPIARPKSWTDADEAEWQATPRKLQEKIAARELDRDTALRRAQNDAAEKLKGLTAKEQAAEQAKQTYEAKLPDLMKALHTVNNTEFSDIRSQDDADLLAVVDPTRWVRWQSHQNRMAATAHELQQAESSKAAKQQTEWQTFRNSEDAKAVELVPELADPKKAAKLMERTGALLGKLGFKPEELQAMISGKEKIAIVDHRLQRLYADSLELADIKAARVAAKAKLVETPVPPVQRPGTPKPAGAAFSDRIQAVTRQLEDTGDIKYATELYMLQQKAARRSA